MFRFSKNSPDSYSMAASSFVYGLPFKYEAQTALFKDPVRTVQ